MVMSLPHNRRSTPTAATQPSSIPPSAPLPERSTYTLAAARSAASECCQSPPPPMWARINRTSGCRRASAHSSTASDASCPGQSRRRCCHTCCSTGAPCSAASSQIGSSRGSLARRLAASLIPIIPARRRSEEHTSELQSLAYLVCRLLLEKKKKRRNDHL